MDKETERDFLAIIAFILFLLLLAIVPAYKAKKDTNKYWRDQLIKRGYAEWTINKETGEKSFSWIEKTPKNIEIKESN